MYYFQKRGKEMLCELRTVIGCIQLEDLEKLCEENMCQALCQVMGL